MGTLLGKLKYFEAFALDEMNPNFTYFPTLELEHALRYDQ